MVFPALASDAGSLKLRIPGITIRSGEEGNDKNDHKEDAGAG